MKNKLSKNIENNSLPWNVSQDPPSSFSDGRHNFIEQTSIAKHLGISMTALNRILRFSGLDNEKHFQLINKKRHYDLNEVLAAIQKGNSNG